ncbi:FAD-binding protein [Erysipelotrichaceae bacterium Oil+RF-744-GAM-WT-6]|jgi:NADPH-dependent 2,4-dienoyl-CoA reductase/sulfur reductase-like enzyme|uniref:FAD-binding protein n=1 Tax=Stecheria intestinalis TaxID=2606630 RepID=A0A7X2TG71_9FIRM|nr:FAD-dependent oxidoreductase [Stecheria intestinalis]MDD7680018.1 FAD-dependent oxidoreductase [Stecheria intestinalis]MDY4681202.1 FAD-dependent oxidoreductase [Lachnospiraceae bacterium]MSS58865.1 FAD-binding protein [Stecheria intestinalis]
MKHYQAAVIGGGSAGLAAAVRLKQLGIEDVIVLEKDAEAGGILNQCIHNGFGLQTFHEQLSGPAYAERFEDQARDLNVEIRLNTMVVRLYPDRRIEYVNPEEGYVTITADAVILAVGCYERSRGAVEIPGERPSGIYTAGQAQRYLNIDGYLVGKKVFILGSGDIGLIMARRMTLEGAKVYGVAELMPYSNGLPRNMKQCLEDFGIPLYLSHTVTHIYGHDRLERIELSEVGKDRKPIPGTEQYFDVDTLLLSVGLIPENHLGDEAGIVMDPRTKGPVVDENYMTSIQGVFACGNGLHVHDLVDFVTHQAAKAAEGAARYLKQETSSGKGISALPGENVGYVVPGLLHPDQLPPIIEFYFRVRKPMDAGTIIVRSGDQIIRQVHKEKLVPSEMEQLVLAGKQLSGLKESLTVEVKEDQ